MPKVERCFCLDLSTSESGRQKPLEALFVFLEKCNLPSEVNARALHVFHQTTIVLAAAPQSARSHRRMPVPLEASSLISFA